ncbi:MAG TPA: alpha/beta hydrolase domain-containing protein [Bryobacteraceae bacterium]|nr:alpha/beta hydrolase domain-containing protein [Bryobacteraceae bacterium]
MLLRATAIGLLLAYSSLAAVTRVELVDRSDVLAGTSFGSTGPYERIAAKVYFAVDPKLAPNRIIADIDLAPRNAEGKVEFSADLYVLKPRDPAKGNGTALVEISNRGGKGLLGMFDLAAGSTDPHTQAEFGDNFLLEQGFTLVWIGWEFDVPATARLMHLYAPIATENGKTITGLVRSEWIGDQRVTTISLGDRSQIGYSVADPNDAANRMFVRDTVNGERRAVPRNKWKFADDKHVTMDDGFEPGKIYEIVYRAKDPVLVGLGPAAIRDMVAFLKHGGEETLLGDQRNYIKQALGFGVSQSGRFLRTFLYDGFNQDEKNRRVFDGVWAHVAGAGRGSFNQRFAQPSRDGHPFLNVAYPVDLAPFNESDGFFAKAVQANVMPKLFLSNGSYEYWGRAASLIHTSEDGKQDAPPGKDTRIYFFAGSQHGAGSIPPRKVEAENTASVNDYRTSMRALLVAMQAWLKDGKEPPASQYPQIGKDQLVTIGALAFPKIVDLVTPRRKREAYRLDFSTEPPKAGPAYPTLIPQVDLDGNETSGIKMPEIAVPLASNTGWNLRGKSIGATDELYSMVGSWIPFPVNQTERENNKDPRLSIEERYKNKRDYLEKITLAAQKLVQSGYLLDQDIPKVRERAAKEWDYVLRSN